MQKLLVITMALMSLLTYADPGKLPRQKVYIKGNVKKELTFKMDYFSKLNPIESKILDPYSNYKEINFTGVYLHNLFDQFAKSDSNVVEIYAINDYKVVITKEEAQKEKMIIAYKGDGKYLTVSQRGPARIVIPGKGKLKDNELAKEGINWVWFVKTLNFK